MQSPGLNNAALFVGWNQKESLLVLTSLVMLSLLSVRLLHHAKAPILQPQLARPQANLLCASHAEWQPGHM